MTIQIPSRYCLVISLAFFLSAVVCLPAFGGDQSVNQEPSTKVKFGDLDLNTDAGRRDLLDRLSKAARRVCEEYGYLHSLETWPEEIHACYSRSLAAAVDKVHHAQLSALFAATSRPDKR